MSFRSITIIITFFISIVYCQGLINVFGLGHFVDNESSMNAGQGLNKILPAYKKNVSILNPSTWPNLKYTQLSMSYNASKIAIPILNEYSSLSSAYWIIPIRGKYAFGLSILPYTNQNIIVNDTTTTMIYTFDDTLSYNRDYQRSGGITAFEVSSGMRINKKINLGAKLHLLFGSSRQKVSITLKGNESWMSGSIIQSSRLRYSGMLMQGFLSFYPDKNTSLMFSFKFPIKSLDGLYNKYFLFQDNNNNGFHDSYGYDFPYPSDVNHQNMIRLKSLHSPLKYAFGLDRSIYNRINLSMELTSFKEYGTIPDILDLGIYDFINISNSISLSLIRYPDDLSINWFDKFTFRSGMKYSSKKLNFSKISISEIGFSFGIGFKFKPVGNQIDINYFIGLREYSQSFDSEIIHQFQAGISLADIWFVKRRQKRNG
tara:strand:- start:15587 stop:16873 length:1287 start_codon:yes stop_codon:yes gene_type:complete